MIADADVYGVKHISDIVSRFWSVIPCESLVVFSFQCISRFWRLDSRPRMSTAVETKNDRKNNGKNDG